MKKLLVKQTDLPEMTEYKRLLDELWGSKWITNNGKYANQLEFELKQKLKVPNIILTNNGTSPLHIVLQSLNSVHGEIITTPFTFAATTNSIIWEHYAPVFVDIDSESFNIDPNQVEVAISKKTVGILAVHVYGNPCDVKQLAIIASRHKIALIYDAAHAFGVEYQGKSVLQFGDFSTLSFHATKAFHTIEGGAIISQSSRDDLRLKPYINFGIVEYGEDVVVAGTNAKMNEFQAAMGLCNLKQYESKTLIRKHIHESYIELLKNIPGVTLQKSTASKENYSYMPIVFDSKKIRDQILLELLKHEIYARKYFYPLTSSYKFIKKSSKRYQTMNAERISDGILCLPLHSSMTTEDVQRVVTIIDNHLS